jgi:hypothetical protein
MVLSPAGLGPENDCVGEGQEQQHTTDPSPLCKVYNRKRSGEKILVVGLKGLELRRTDWR